ncbi:iron complex transport system permease protein [Ketogulonicigenium robustum]|uniref:Iron complex transport system permease protein n=1 Tax=Ketogulonicigenium robustum TaxID=92947 RepID=A0A1W6P050_9RHOB|nr:iron chelate uptake ABC transporter family permease subunit [Ketogulonicigenium robustum]ARO14885.1 iron complex transport system permease protein [Ketogulonicigenium robustum]
MIRALFLFALLTVLLMLSLCLGAHPLSPVAVAQLLAAQNAQDFLVWNHRLPRALIALVLGGAIGLAGALVQGVIRNPLASPDLLGVTQGAGMTLAGAILLFPDLSVNLLPLIAIAGGALGAVVLMIYNAGNFSPLRFALSGVALSAGFAGVTEFLLLTHPVAINTALMSLTGSLWARGWEQMPLVLLVLPVALLALPLAKSLDLIGLGDETAHALGVHLGRVQFCALSLAVLLTGIAVAVLGPVGFIGLVAPHIARLATPGRAFVILPASAAFGGAIMMAADLLGRAISPPLEVPVGVMTAVIGAPYFLWLLFRMR